MADQEDPYDLDAANARFAAAGDEEHEKGFFDKIGGAVKTATQNSYDWTLRLPKNVGVGAYKAALNTIDTVDEIASAAGEGAAKVAEKMVPGSGPLHAGTSLKEIAPDFYDAAHSFGDDMTQKNTLSDDITQSIAQFTIPFAGYTKALGAAGLVKPVAGLVGEAIAAATAFGAHDPRMADLVKLGRESETRFGEVLRKVAPDGSLINRYIDYMTSRGNETTAEGRFKNAVDAVATTTVLGALLKSAAVGMKVGKQVIATPPKVGRAAQRGMVDISTSPPTGELTDIERARALKSTIVNEIPGEHITLEGDTVNQNATVTPIRPEKK